MRFFEFQKSTVLTIVAAMMIAGPAMAQHQGWDVERDGYVTTATTTKDSGEEGFSVSCDASAPYSDPYFTMWVGGGVGIGDPGSVIPADFSIDGRNTRSVVLVDQIDDDYLVYTMVSPDITNDLRSGRHLTVSIPSLGLRETFSLRGADDAIEQVLEGCN